MNENDPSHSSTPPSGPAPDAPHSDFSERAPNEAAERKRGGTSKGKPPVEETLDDERGSFFGGVATVKSTPSAGALTDTDEGSALPRDSISEFSSPEILAALNLPDERFSVEGKIGEGASGTVYAVNDRYLDRTIAVKLASVNQNARRVARFIREAQVAASLDHPNIVPVFNLGISAGGRIYLAMRQIKGQSLGDIIACAAPEAKRHALIATPNDVVNIALKVCDAVGCAHDRGIVHQDIKPDNIMLGEHGEVLLIDWGTASESKTRGLRGTPAYMAPEQARKEGASQLSDIYALGATVFHALYLRLPTAADTLSPTEFWAKKKQGKLDRLAPDESRRVPPRLAAIVHKALEPNPKDRYQSIAEMREDLHAFQSGLAVSAYRESLPERIIRWYRRHRKTCQAVLSMIVVLLAVTGVYLYDAAQSRQAKEQAELRALKLEKERTERWHLVLNQDFARTKALDPRFRPDAPPRFNADGLVMWIDSPFRELNWTKPIGIEQKIEVTFSCDTTPHFMIKFCCNDKGDGSMFELRNRFVTLSTIREGGLRWTPLAEGDLGQENRLHANARNTVVVWREGNRFLIEINGQKVLDYNNTTAPWSAEHGLFSLYRRYGFGPLTIHSVRVWRRLQPDYVPVLEPGKELLRTGNAPAALEWFKAHQDNIMSPSLRQEAQYLVTRCLTTDDVTRKQKLLSDIVAEKSHSFRVHAMHDLSLLLAEAGRSRESFDLACTATTLAPEHGTLSAVFDRIIDHLRSMPTDEKLAAVKRMFELPLSRFSAPNFGLTDLSVVQGSSARSLRLADNPIASLEPLRGARLYHLELGPAPANDLGPLKEMPLESLTLTGMPAADLKPLHGKSFTYLKLKGCPSIDFASLRGVRARMLHIERCPINDHAFIRTTGAHILRIRNTHLPDVGFAASLPLHRLTLVWNGFSNIEPLAACKGLRSLYLNGNPVRDISPLRALPLTALRISRTQVADLSPLANSSLRELNLSHTPVTDLSALSGLPLEVLDISGTTVRDLSVLSRLPRLKTLRLKEMALDDKALEVLAGLSLTDLSIDIDTRSLAVLESMATLKRVGLLSADYVRRTGPAIALALKEESITSRHAKALKTLAKPGTYATRLLVPISMSYSRATKFCRALGGTLACPSTAREAADLRAYLATVCSSWDLAFWVGLEHRNGEMAFQSGAPLEWAKRSLKQNGIEALRAGARVHTDGNVLISSSPWRLSIPASELKLPFVIEWRIR